VAHAHAFAQALPDAREEIVPDAGHYPYLEQPDAFAQLIEGFLRS
jgi:pimeloyl-ACP methyl ester carboxylesterase